MNTRFYFISILLLIGFGFSKLKAQNQDSITVYVFLSETCPICQSSTLELKKLHEVYGGKGIAFVGLFPNTKLSSEASRTKFQKKYKLPFTLNGDEGRAMMQQLSATITPQTFVVRNKGQKVLYEGKVDNSFEAIGRRRTVVTEHYLQKALDDILNGQPVKLAQTKPVGCFIAAE